MSYVGQPECATRNRVIALFRDELGYRYLGAWSDREGNSDIEEALLTGHLTKRGYSWEQIGVALHKLRIEADHHGRSSSSSPATTRRGCNAAPSAPERSIF